MPKPRNNIEGDKALQGPANDSYSYQPLNEAKKQVRIFRLAPGKFDQPIRGSLITISLDKLRRRKWKEVREWTALSYVWGTSGRDEAIKVSRRNLFISRTLGIALQYLRWPDIQHYLWIDQICIYFHRPTTKYLGILKFTPQFSEGFNFTHLASQIWLLQSHYCVNVMTLLGTDYNGSSKISSVEFI